MKKDYTYTSTFCFPLLGIPKTIFSYKKSKKVRNDKSLFKNCYLTVTGMISKKDYSVYILIEQVPRVTKRLIKVLITYSNYESHFNANEKYTVFIFTIDKRFEFDFDLLMMGKYSLLSMAAKNIILKNHFFSGDKYYLSLIFDKSPTLKLFWESKLDCKLDRGAEVWPIIQSSEETLLLSDLDEDTSQRDSVKICLKNKNNNKNNDI